ncbi:MAG: hypothetical protein N7Q72_01745 [Spiroplasma sp. Tabriz.8]|nr:hypothetical protein [Spiroplasma sp. Tabriz.8]
MFVCKLGINLYRVRFIIILLLLSYIYIYIYRYIYYLLFFYYHIYILGCIGKHNFVQVCENCLKPMDI